jgi:hypothetical protein
MAPLDARFAEVLLEHQMRQCGQYADEVLLTLDLHPAGASRRMARDTDAARDCRNADLRPIWEKCTEDLLKITAEFAARYPKVRSEPVDWSEKVATEMAAHLFGGRRIPKVDYRGRPFYSYFYGLHSAANDHVRHLDSDMFLGGGSPTWFDEAIALLEEHDDIFTCTPFPGPARSDHVLTTQVGDAVPGRPASYAFHHFSSRVFFLDRRGVQGKTPPRVTLPPRWRDIPRATLFGRAPVGTAEDAIGSAMRRAGTHRVDFLGEGTGLWSLHPPYRSDLFFESLPRLVEMVETDDIPDGQRGDFDMNESMIDWSDAIAQFRANRWHR